MPENILDKIIKKKIEQIDKLKKNISIESLEEKIKKNKSFINFKDKIDNNIRNNKISIIAEIKKLLKLQLIQKNWILMQINLKILLEMMQSLMQKKW